MKFSAETKVNEIALAHPAARRILEDAGVDYCCAGGKSLHEACLHADVPVEEILNQLRQNSEFVDPEQSEWISRPLAELTRHIRQHHHQYVRDASAINDPPQFSSAERKAQKIVCPEFHCREIFAPVRDLRIHNHWHSRSGLMRDSQNIAKIAVGKDIFTKQEASFLPRKTILQGGHCGESDNCYAAPSGARLAPLSRLPFRTEWTASFRTAATMRLN